MIIEHHADIHEPDYTSKDDCLVIYSPETITIKPKQDAYMDLKLNVNFKNQPAELLHLPQLWLKLSTVFKTVGLYVEDSEE